MDYISLGVQLLSGAIGGNAAGSILKNLSLGTLGNSLAGIIGGGLGGQLLNAALGIPAGAPLDLHSVEAILTQFAGGGVGGAVLMAIVGMIKGAMAKA